MSELNHCQNLQNHFLQVLCFYLPLPFIAETFQGRPFDGGLSSGIASLMSIVRQKISIILRIQAFRDLTLFLGGEYFPALDCLAVRSFRPSVTTCTVTQSHIPEEGNLQQHRLCENEKYRDCYEF